MVLTIIVIRSRGGKRLALWRFGLLIMIAYGAKVMAE